MSKQRRSWQKEGGEAACRFQVLELEQLVKEACHSTIFPSFDPEGKLGGFSKRGWGRAPWHRV